MTARRGEGLSVWAWIAAAAGTACAALGWWAAIHLAGLPPGPTRLATPMINDCVLVSLPDQVIEVGLRGIARIGSDLRYQRLSDDDLREVSAVAWNGVDLAVIAGANDDHPSAILIPGRAGGAIARFAKAGWMSGLRAQGDHFIAYRVDFDSLQPVTLSRSGLVFGSRWQLPESMAGRISGLTWIDGQLHLLLARDHHHPKPEVTDLHGVVRPTEIPSGCSALAAAGSFGDLSRCFIDGRGTVHRVSDGIDETTLFAATGGGDLEALEGSEIFAPSFLRSTTFQGRTLFVDTTGNRIGARLDHGPWREVASASPILMDLRAAPLGEGWLVFGTGRRAAVAVLLDGRGRRLDRPHLSYAAMLDEVSWHSSWLWLLPFALLLFLGGAVPVAIACALYRLADRAAPGTLDPRGSAGVFTGELHLPPGRILQTARFRRVVLVPEAEVVIDRERVALGPGLRRADVRDDVPLIDRSDVYVVGRLECDDADGPMRGARRWRLVPDGKRYLIGQGHGSDLQDHLAQRSSRRILRLAILELACALLLLLQFGLAPFGW